MKSQIFVCNPMKTLKRAIVGVKSVLQRNTTAKIPSENMKELSEWIRVGAEIY